MQNLDNKKKYTLAVSGGSDSMAMLDMFRQHTPCLNFSVVTVDHNLRSQSKDDCLVVEGFCKKFGIPFVKFSVDVLSFCKAQKVSIETGARTLRFEIFEKLDADFVCLAHNADDNAETVILNLIRGSGTTGARGILSINGRYLHPLLDFRKSELTDYCKLNNVPFVVDQSNFDCRHSRNFVRNEIFPKLFELNPNAVENLNRFAKISACQEEFLESLVDFNDVEIEGNCLKIEKKVFRQARPVVLRLLKRALQKIGWQRDFESVHFESILRLAENFGGKTICLPFDFVATNEYNKITICKPTESKVQDFEIAFRIGTIETPLGVVKVSKEAVPEALFFDLSKVPPTAVFRTQRQGDFFCKFGGGTKPLNRFFIDRKIPKAERNNVLLLCNGSEVLIVCGVEICQSLKVADEKEKYFLSFQKL